MVIVFKMRGLKATRKLNVNGVLIASIYLPNGNSQPRSEVRLQIGLVPVDYKSAWFRRLIEHGAERMKAGVPVILAGDYNVVTG
jgi:exodeoxyribonuclease-3